MRAVPRDFYATKLTCRAQGTQLIDPVEKEVTIQLHCKCFIVILYFMHTYCVWCWWMIYTDFETADINRFPTLQHYSLYVCHFVIVSFSLSHFSLQYKIVKPLKVKIVSPNEILTADVKTPLRCEAWGSAPPGLYIVHRISINCIVYLFAFFWFHGIV